MLQNNIAKPHVLDSSDFAKNCLLTSPADPCSSRELTLLSVVEETNTLQGTAGKGERQGPKVQESEAKQIRQHSS